MRVLITGAGGFVGKHLIDHLKSQAIEVYGTGKNIEETDLIERKAVPAFLLDVCDLDSITQVLNRVRPEHIIHLAAQSSAGLSWSQRLGTIEVNILGTVKLIEGIIQTKLDAAVLLAGSAEEYGYVSPDQLPLTEDSPVNPANPYGVSKAILSYLPRLYSKISGLRLVHARAFNHIGPQQSEGFVVSDFAKQIAEIEKGLRSPVISVGNLAPQRDFLDVRDVVKAYTLLSERGKGGETYNVCSGTYTSIRNILDMLLQQSSKPIEIVTDVSKIRPVDVPLLYGDNSKLKQEGWLQTIGIREALTDVLNYWREAVNEGEQISGGN